MLDDSRNAIQFLCMCLKEAWRGSWARANAISNLIGAFLVWAVAASLGYHVVVPKTFTGTIILGVICLLAAWIVVFVFRFILAPSRLFYTEVSRSNELAEKIASGETERRHTDAMTAHTEALKKAVTPDIAELVNAIQLAPNLHSDTNKFIRADGSSTDLYRTTYFLIVGNALQTGKVLRHLQARLQMFGPPVLLPIKGSDTGNIDVRHGEWAYINIGYIVSRHHSGMYKGACIVDEERLRTYEHNVSIGALSFEVENMKGEREFGLGMTIGLENIWKALTVISADDVLSFNVEVQVDLSKPADPIRAEKLLFRDVKLAN